MSHYSAATWKPCPKHGYPSTDIHLGEGVVIHSAEGSLAAAEGVLAGPREASWHFFVCKDGRVFQYVDSANIAWTNGSFESNKKFWGIENEGMAGEALTSPQFESLAKLVKWLLGSLPYVRGQTLFEHREMTAFGALPTACPSGRIPWNGLIAAMEDDMGMTDAETAAFAALKARVAILEQKPYCIRSVSDPTVYFAAGGVLFSVRDGATWDKLKELGYCGPDAKTLPDNHAIWKSPKVNW